MRWKLLSSAITTSLFVRSSASTFEMESAPPSSAPGAGAGAGAPGAPGATPPMIGRRPGFPAWAGCAWKIWFTLSARSRAEAYFTWMSRMSSPEPGRSSASSRRSMRRTLRPRSVMMRTSGGMDWMSAPCGEVKFPMIPRSWSGSA